MIKEISRRCESHVSCGFACGPCSMDVVIGELVIEIDGETRYITCEWVSEANDCVEFEISDEPIWDYFMDDDADLDGLDEIRSKEAHEMYSADLTEEFTEEYAEQFTILRQMVLDKVREEDWYLPEDDEE